GIHLPSTSVHTCPEMDPERFSGPPSTFIFWRNSAVFLKIFTSQSKTLSCFSSGFTGIRSPTVLKFFNSVNTTVVSNGPQSGSKSLEYKYHFPSTTALKMISISSPVFAFSVETVFVQATGFSTCATEKELVRKTTRNNGMNLRMAGVYFSAKLTKCSQ